MSDSIYNSNDQLMVKPIPQGRWLRWQHDRIPGQAASFETEHPTCLETANSANVATHATAIIVQSPYDGFDSTLNHKAEDEATHWRWRILFPEGRAIEIRYRPEVSRKEVEGHYPGATVVPLPDEERKRAATPAEQVELAALVASVYADETQTERNEALTKALADPDDALACYRTIAIDRGLARAVPDQDNRRWCTDCANLAAPDRDGARRCLAATCGELEDGVKRTYHPTTDIPRRCEAFTPLAGDPDQRTGAELWPYLLANNQRPRGGGRTR